MPGSTPDTPQVLKEHPRVVYVNTDQVVKTSIPGSLSCPVSVPFLSPFFFEKIIIVSGCITVIELGYVWTSTRTCRPRSNEQGARIVSSAGTYTARDPFRHRLRSLQVLRAHLLMGTIFFSFLLHSQSFVSQNCQSRFGTMVDLQQRHQAGEGIREILDSAVIFAGLLLKTAFF